MFDKLTIFFFALVAIIVYFGVSLCLKNQYCGGVIDYNGDYSPHQNVFGTVAMF